MDGINLSTKFPIPFAASAHYFIDGASFVIYDESGGRPTYSKMPYHLYE
jgi:hypothetical protein